MTSSIAYRVQDLLIDTFDPDWRELDCLYRFDCLTQGEGVVIWDRATDLRNFLPYELAVKERLDVVNWYCTITHWAWLHSGLVWRDPYLPWKIPTWLFAPCHTNLEDEGMEVTDNELLPSLDLSGIQVPQGSYTALERNATVMKDFKRPVPKPIVVVVHINGHPV